MLRLPDSWLWDFWLVDDGVDYHLFFLFASRALGDPDLRHGRAAVGHAVSPDLISWQRCANALVPGRPDDPDAQATWTGSVVRAPDGEWLMFYTGLRAEQGSFVQRICLASSDDLTTWTKRGVVLEADPSRYESTTTGKWAELSFRDPWVYPDPDGAGWHMLITARVPDGPEDGRGVLAGAHSPDLLTWRLGHPVTQPHQGFGHLEVPQVNVVDGRAVLLFSCLDTELSAARRATGSPGGTWYVAADSVLGPFDVSSARLLNDRTQYSGRLCRARDGRWMHLAFRYDGPDGAFVGELTDPSPVRWDGAALVLDAPATSSSIQSSTSWITRSQ